MGKRSQSADEPVQSPEAEGHERVIVSADAVAEDMARAGATPPGAAPSPDELVELRQKAAERDEFLNLLQRVRADYLNYQKRIQKETDLQRRYASQPLIYDLLPVIDNLERALRAPNGSNNQSGLLDGIRLVHQQLLAALARHGVQSIPADGLPFDPDVHEALQERSSRDQPPRTVLEELEKGYRLHDRVIRPSKVVVARAAGPGAGSQTAEGPETESQV